VVRWLPVLVWAGILGGVVALVLISWRPETHDVVRAISHGPQGPAVPTVERLRAREARELLERSGFWVRTAHEPSNAVRAGRAVGTSPPAATRLDVGAQVTLLISSGKRRVRVPELAGLSRSTAEERVLARGFRVVIVRRESLEPPGAVIDQSPPAGRRVPSRTAVRIAVAARPAPVTVPAVSGMPFERAVERASGAGLAVGFAHRRARRRSEVGRVLAQSRRAGDRAPRGARVTLTIAVAR